MKTKNKTTTRPRNIPVTDIGNTLRQLKMQNQTAPEIECNMKYIVNATSFDTSVLRFDNVELRNFDNKVIQKELPTWIAKTLIKSKSAFIVDEYTVMMFPKGYKHSK